jgi:hypothetical protein
MAKLPDLFVNAVATFDGKALAKGQKQIGGFEKGVKKFAKVFAAAFSVTAITAFGKASVKAFAEDEKAAAKLTRTVTNLGLGFENARITKFISDLEQTAAVSDDVLRPAFQSLLTTTGSVEKSQKLLALALDISAGSGEDVATVAGDLSSAYVGQTKSLSKYRLGLSKAELQGKSFAEIQELLNKQFSGQNSARLETYAGKMEALKVAAGNAQEIIGKGIVDALSKLGDDKSIENLAANMEKAAKSTADVIRGIGVLAAKLKTIPGFDSKDWEYVYNISYLKFLQDLGAADAIKPKPFTTPMTISGSTDLAVKEAKARAAAEAAAAKRAKELLALQKKAALVEKNKLSLSKAAAVFDTNRISIAAALRATYDKETILRLEALQAIEEDNGELALKKINELAALQKNADMAKLAGITQISNATLEAINTQLLNELTAIDKSKMAETDKENARQIAFGKYNAAITAAGELAAKESYSERVQIQLTEIAKLASLSKTSNASLTLNKLRESEELAMIDRVAKAQKAADDARLKALQEYAAALGRIGTGGGAVGGVTGTTPGSVGGAPGSPSGAPATIADVKAKEAADAIKYFADTVTDTFQTVEDSGAFNALVKSFMGGAINSFNAGEFRANEGGAYGGLSRGGAFDRDTNVTINVNTGIGDPEAIARAIEDTLNQSSYRGTSVNRGSGDYLVA